MWLSDIESAVKNFRKIFGDCCGWTGIECSWDGTLFSFKTDNPDGSYYIYHRKTRRIEKVWKDTWRTGRKEVIFEGE